MENFPLESFAWNCLFGLFLFYQQLHYKLFRGSSKLFEFFLGISVAAGMLTGIFYLGYLAWTKSFFTAAAIFLLSLLPAFLYKVIEKLIPPFGLSLFGFIGWPLSAYFMFLKIPE